MSLFTYPSIFPVRSAFGPRFDGVSRLHDDIDRLFGGFFGQPEASGGKAQAEPACVADFLPGMDLASSEKAYAMHVELPGVAPEDVAVKVEDRILTVEIPRKAPVKPQARSIEIAKG